MLVPGRRFLDGIANVQLEAARKPVEGQVHHGSGVERQQLTENQAADNCNAQRTAQFRTDARPQRERQATKQSSHGGHHDGPEAQQAGFVDGVEGRFPFLALGLEREVNHHDGVFLDNADEQDDANERNDAEFGTAKHQRKNGADTSGGERRKNRNWVDVAFIQNPENDVHGDYGGENQNRLIRERPEKSRSSSLERGLYAGRHVQFLFRPVYGVDRFT